MTEVYMDGSSAELLVLTILGLIGTCAAVADVIGQAGPKRVKAEAVR
jgi:hypothetical protein